MEDSVPNQILKYSPTLSSQNISNDIRCNSLPLNKRDEYGSQQSTSDNNSSDNGSWDSSEIVERKKQPPKLRMISSNINSSISTNNDTLSNKSNNYKQNSPSLSNCSMYNNGGGGINPPKLTPIQSNDMASITTQNHNTSFHNHSVISASKLLKSQSEDHTSTISSNNTNGFHSLTNSTISNSFDGNIDNQVIDNNNITNVDYSAILESIDRLQYERNTTNTTNNNNNDIYQSLPLHHATTVDTTSGNNQDITKTNDISSITSQLDPHFFGLNGCSFVLDDADSWFTSALNFDNIPNYQTSNPNNNYNSINFTGQLNNTNNNIFDTNTSLAFGDGGLLSIGSSPLSPTINISTRIPGNDGNGFSNSFEYIDVCAQVNANDTNMFGSSSMIKRHFYNGIVDRSSGSNEFVLAKPPSVDEPIGASDCVFTQNANNNILFNGTNTYINGCSSASVNDISKITTTNSYNNNHHHHNNNYSISCVDRNNSFQINGNNNFVPNGVRINSDNCIFRAGNIRSNIIHTNNTHHIPRKLSSSRRRNDTNDPQAAVKRHNHNMLERKRRGELRESFGTLIDLIPELRGSAVNRLSKVKILIAATEHVNKIVALKNTKIQLENKKQKLTHAIVEKLKYLSSLNQLSISESRLK